jgi:hypothetical protein
MRDPSRSAWRADCPALPVTQAAHPRQRDQACRGSRRQKINYWPNITSRGADLFVNDPAALIFLNADQYWKGSMIRFAGLLCLLLSVLSGPALAGSCVVPHIRTLDNQTVNGTMYVVSGQRCSIVMVLSPGPVHGAKLVSRPSHGSVSIDGGRVVYASSAGYIGDDHFTYARKGLNPLNQPVTRTVDVNVKVSARL